MRKVIHIVESLDRGATEVWLVRMLRHASRNGIGLDWTFYCTVGSKSQMDDEVRALGGKIVYSPYPLGDKLRFISALRRELKRGRYEVLHSHHDLVSAVYLLASLGLPIARKVVHVHNASGAIPTRPGVRQRILRGAMRRTSLQIADKIVGVAGHVLTTYLDGRPRDRDRDTVLYCGIDTSDFENICADRVAFRRSLNLPDDARILLFAGRMVPEKGPLFAVDVLAEMHTVDSNIAGVFVGSGSLEQDVRDKAIALGLKDSFRQLGWRSDIPQVMSCCDCFIQPGPEEPKEGLGLAIVEAQLAGLPLLFSLGIPDDAILPSASFRRVPLAAGAKVWADAARELLRRPRPSQAKALEELKASPFEMNFALSALIDLHAG